MTALVRYQVHVEGRKYPYTYGAEASARAAVALLLEEFDGVSWSRGRPSGISAGNAVVGDCRRIELVRCVFDEYGELQSSESLEVWE